MIIPLLSNFGSHKKITGGTTINQPVTMCSSQWDWGIAATLRRKGKGSASPSRFGLPRLIHDWRCVHIYIYIYCIYIYNNMYIWYYIYNIYIYICIYILHTYIYIYNSYIYIYIYTYVSYIRSNIIISKNGSAIFELWIIVNWPKKRFQGMLNTFMWAGKGKRSNTKPCLYWGEFSHFRGNVHDNLYKRFGDTMLLKAIFQTLANVGDFLKRLKNLTVTLGAQTTAIPKRKVNQHQKTQDIAHVYLSYVWDDWNFNIL